jgi:hypothetical protein
MILEPRIGREMEITAWRSRQKALFSLERIRRGHKFRRSSPSHRTVANYLSPEEGADVVNGAKRGLQKAFRT